MSFKDSIFGSFGKKVSQGRHVACLTKPCLPRWYLVESVLNPFDYATMTLSFSGQAPLTRLCGRSLSCCTLTPFQILCTLDMHGRTKVNNFESTMEDTYSITEEQLNVSDLLVNAHWVHQQVSRTDYSPEMFPCSCLASKAGWWVTRIFIPKVATLLREYMCE